MHLCLVTNEEAGGKTTDVFTRLGFEQLVKDPTTDCVRPLTGIS